MISLRILVLIALLSRLALAHAGEPLAPHDLWTAWELEPGAVVPLMISGLLYAIGARRRRGVRQTEMLYFWAGWLILALALISPLHPLGEVLFSAHMAQHEILMLCAAPLMVLSRPLIPMMWGLPLPTRKAIGRWTKRQWVQGAWSAITLPISAWWIHAVALWSWHAPALFQATLNNEWVHAVQHMSFFVSALLFWWALLCRRGPAGYGPAILYLFTTTVHTSVLGALLTFSKRVWYPEYGSRVANWGLSALEDQQIGGLIMWVPASLIYVAAALLLLAAWLKQSDRLIAGNYSS
jgi:cytochrome c oxidase assembly factor CtaG